MLPEASCVKGTFSATRCVLSVVPLAVVVSRRASSIDCPSVGALCICALGVHCFAGAAHFDRRAGMAHSIEIIFNILSLSIVVLCDVVAIIGNGLIVFGNSFDHNSSDILSNAVLALRG